MRSAAARKAGRSWSMSSALITPACKCAPQRRTRLSSARAQAAHAPAADERGGGARPLSRGRQLAEALLTRRLKGLSGGYEKEVIPVDQRIDKAVN